MDTKHTPFAVVKDDEGKYEIHTKDGFWISIYKSQQTAKTDSTLMAAAPELLKALQDLMEWSKQMGDWSSIVWQNAQEAILKATGNER